MKNIKKSILFFSISAVLSVVFLGAAFILWADVKNSSDSLSSLKGQISSRQKEIEQSLQIKNTEQFLNESSAKIDSFFVDYEVPVNFVESLENIAKESHLFVEISSASSAKPANAKWKSLSFNLNLAGSFPDFLYFLNKIENSPYFIKLEELNIQKISKENLGQEKYGGSLPQGSINAVLLIGVLAK